ncbi:hypothetical protein SPRG_19873 [Saprolegnia parasitica CBS 223.65]|uniref:Glutamine cyclotransferase n=1 Tax=Saprolegnia parasitica (strain CBS 223.65) TaxID=695850 RepID=A0A067CFG0_SAPPC|nr:hypothetical protein SPRG_19873 [Saprolegnia parasitica CBS 223.65]KDO29198.1 hypothetical protein SPRG_19873 [Saprolegnia parasitica CBS 223.65]|eukprot:XP_012200100.1 hypothetical protein SPRG_19873 [Saprolegnia parasitica CBS 223.65]
MLYPWAGLALVCLQVLAQEAFAGFGAIVADASSVSSPYAIVAIHPHNVSSFTEGLLFDGGHLLESTGLSGQSFIRELDALTGLCTGNEFKFPDGIFGEGITVLNGTIYALSYQAKIGYALDRSTFALQREFAFATTTGEGWGMTNDGAHLIVSDGSATLLFLDPTSLVEVRRIVVTQHGADVRLLNELEYIAGEIFANVWYTNQILRIDPATGHVRDALLLDQLPLLENHARTIAAEDWRKMDAVMNGIAHNPLNDHVYVTGKLWDAVFELDLALPKVVHGRRVH